MDKITIEVICKMGQIVYLKTDSDQKARIVVGIRISPKETLYELASGELVSSHYDFEISTEKTVVINE